MPEPDIDQAIRVLDAALAETNLANAWRVVKRHIRRTRRISRTLPRIFGIAQHVTIALDLFDTFFPLITPELYERARIIRDHLLAVREALRTGREDEETQPRIDIENA